jgi:hypothetical protein
MAKRDFKLMKKTTTEPEILEETPEQIRDQPADGYVPVEYDAFDDAPPDFVKPLSATESKRRAELEGLITRNFKAFYDVGCALREIQQRMLYRDTHKRFDDYCKSLWDMARAYAYRLIGAADIVDNIIEYRSLEDASDEHEKSVAHGRHAQLIPQNERQTRALAKFDPDQQRTVWTEAVNTAPDGKVTASHIKKTARRLHLEKVKETVAKARRQTNQAPRISEDFRRAFNEFLDAINIERANEYKNTDQNEVIRHVRIILEALEAEL